MAVKDHSLDKKIIQAATAEFLEHGFQNASLRQIAQRAGITTGALYTRYKNKDVLFCSLIEPILGKISTEYLPIYEAYMNAQTSRNPEKIMEAIRKEEQFHLDIMFSYYDQCVLFFCRSDGSSVQKILMQQMEHKAANTVAFFQSIAKKEINLDGLEMILSEQYHYYRKILEKGYDKEKAISCMKCLESFMEAGWNNLFMEIM